MVICSYFMKGACRFGDTCKNEHSYNAENSSSVMKKGEVDDNSLIRAASGDMLKAEKGNQWPLSCFGPYQGKPSFPGFEDKCFEEIRLGFYEAQKNNTLEEYKAQLTTLLQEARMKMKSLQNPTPEATNMLKEIYFSNGNGTNNQKSIFGNPVGQSMFDNKVPQQSNSIFGNKPTSHSNSIFGAPVQPTPTNVTTQNSFSFALPESKSIFGNNPTPTQGYATSNSIFGNTAQQNTFGTANVTQNTFAGVTPQSPFGGTSTLSQSPFGNATANPPNAFGGPTATVTPNSFGGTPTAVNQSPFAAATPIANPSIFGGATATNQSIFGGIASTQPSTGFPNSVFQNTASQNPVIPNAHNQSIFGNATPVSVPTNPPTFGSSPFSTQNTRSFAAPFVNNDNTANVNPFLNQNVAKNANLFHNSASSTTPLLQTPVFNTDKPAQSHTNSIFGNKVTQSLGVSVNRTDDPTIYTKLSDLTTNDVAQYEKQCFDFGKIPTRAPPLEMC